MGMGTEVVVVGTDEEVVSAAGDLDLAVEEYLVELELQHEQAEMVLVQLAAVVSLSEYFPA